MIQAAGSLACLPWGREGQRHGTILCDLEQDSRVIELLFVSRMCGIIGKKLKQSSFTAIRPQKVSQNSWQAFGCQEGCVQMATKRPGQATGS
jgi:hypothetical protein